MNRSQTLRKRLDRLEEKLNPPFRGVLFVPEGRSAEETESLIRKMCAERRADRATVPVVTYSELDLAI